MIPQEEDFSLDEYGCPTLLVKKESLQDFPKLVSHIRAKGYGTDQGLIKLRRNDADRRDDDLMKDVIKVLREKFSMKNTHDEDQRKRDFYYNPSNQQLVRAALHEHVYEFQDVNCTKDERRKFVREAVQIKSYETEENCCTQSLKKGQDALRHHLLEEAERDSVYPLWLQQQLSESGGNARVKQTEMKRIYGAGIHTGEKDKLEICDGFSLNSLDEVLPLMEETYDGITWPYIYVGKTHTLFPWHIEDGGLYSINYLVKGACKLWFGISSENFGLMSKIAGTLRINKQHGSCTALLSDHKVLVADPEFFKREYAVPYITVVQEPGDFIVTLPFALHSGFNLGTNCAIAANFGDIPWLEWGIYAPVCECNPNQVHFNFTNMLKAFRPDLLKAYEENAALLWPADHPREVRRPAGPNQQRAAAEQRQHTPNSSGAASKIKERVLTCPKCRQQYVGNKMARLRQHIARAGRTAFVLIFTTPKWRLS